VTPFVTMATRDGAKLIRKQRPERRPDDDLVNHFSPAQEIQVFCTVEEIEDFEAHTEVRLDADIIDDPTAFGKLVEFLSNDFGLKVI
jgi:hypothetical protein